MIEAESEWTDDLDERAFTLLVESHHPDMLRLAYGMTGDRELAQDVAQAAWSAAWRYRHQLRDPDKTRPWLLRITANEARRSRSKRRRWRWLPLTHVADSVAASRPADTELDLLAALSGLSDRDRAIVILRYGLGATSGEIGQVVRLSESGVRVRLGRILARLREELADE